MIKAELHSHIEGAADPALVLRLARKYGVKIQPYIDKSGYIWEGFNGFLACYDACSAVFRAPEDYRLLSYSYFSKLAEQGAIYAETFGSPDHAAAMGIGYQDLVEALSEGIEDATAEFGIEGRIIMTCVRHLGPENAVAVAEQIASNPHPVVTGFGMAGDERAFDVEDFASAFAIAADAGLGLTCHAGEFAGPQSVMDALDILNVSRIGHGVRSIEDPELIERIAHDGIVLEVCPTSNIALKVYDGFADHPLRQLMDAGVRICLNSDDPPYFSTSLANEYGLAREKFRFSDDELNQCTRTALEAAFVDESTRKRLLKKFDANS